MSAAREGKVAGERRWSEAEYLRFEDASPFRHEYFNGRIYPLGSEEPLDELPQDPSDESQYPERVRAMAGASVSHNRLTMAVTASFLQQFQGSGCEVWPGDTRIRIPRTGLYTYPDVAVSCGEPDLEEGTIATLLNPIVVVEVLSPSTQRYDEGDKRAQYESLEGLRNYILVAQDAMHVEHHARQGDGTWLSRHYRDPDDSFALVGAEATLQLSTLYQRVVLPLPSPRSPRAVRLDQDGSQ